MDDNNFLVNKDYWKYEFMNNMNNYIDEDNADEEYYRKGFNDAYRAALNYAEIQMRKQERRKVKKKNNK